MLPCTYIYLSILIIRTRCAVLLVKEYIGITIYLYCKHTNCMTIRTSREIWVWYIWNKIQIHLPYFDSIYTCVSLTVFFCIVSNSFTKFTVHDPCNTRMQVCQLFHSIFTNQYRFHKWDTYCFTIIIKSSIERFEGSREVCDEYRLVTTLPHQILFMFFL